MIRFLKCRPGRYATVLAAVVLGVGAVLAVTPAAGAAAATASAEYLDQTSCISASACVAVGSSDNGSAVVTLAEDWNGTSWAVQSTPNPSGASASELNGVSCTSPSACIAVGWYETSSGTYKMLAEDWNGTSWAIQSTPTPSGALHSQLGSVSCTSASACTAIGFYQTSTGANPILAERWNGTAWTIQSVPTPSGALHSQLGSVSCTSASACTAVGSYGTDTGGHTLAEDWNGATWAVQSTPIPSGAQGSFLDGVSCTSASACTAVGYGVTSAGAPSTLAEDWNGTTWTIQSTPNPSSYTMLKDVSCSSASACTAVGYSFGSAGVPLAEAWNGTAWTVQSTPNPSTSLFSELDGVSCTSASACTTVGYYATNLTTPGYEYTLAEGWDGTAWIIQSTPSL